MIVIKEDHVEKEAQGVFKTFVKPEETVDNTLIVDQGSDVVGEIVTKLKLKELVLQLHYHLVLYIKGKD